MSGTTRIALARPRSPLLGIVLLCLVQILLAFDVVGVSMVLPAIDAGFRVGTASLTWLITAYSLCYGALPFFAGRLGEAVGRRKVLLAGLALFGASALLAAFGDSWTLLLWARGGQGVGAGLAIGAALALLEANFPEGRTRNRALTAFFASAGTAAAFSPLLAAWLAETTDWQTLFLTDGVVALLVAALLPLTLGETAPGTRDGLLAAAGVGVLLVALSRVAAVVSGLRWPGVATVVVLVAVAVLPTALTWVARSDRAPLAFAWLRDNRPAVGAYTVVAVLAVCLFGSMAALQFGLQASAGLSLSESVTHIAVAAPAVLLGCAVLPPLAARVGLRPVLAGAALVTALGLTLLARWFGGVALAGSGMLLPLALVAFGAGVIAAPVMLGHGGARMAGLNSARQLGVSLGGKVTVALVLVAEAREAAAATSHTQTNWTPQAAAAAMDAGMNHGATLFCWAAVALCVTAAVVAVLTQTRPATAPRARPAAELVG